MNLGNVFVKSVVSQVGRETGRSIANKALKGSNSYNIKNVNTDYDSKHNKNDSLIVSKIKEINKLKPLTTPKGNTNRLMELLNIGSELIDETISITHENINDLGMFLKRFNNKLDLLSSLIPDDYESSVNETMNEKLDEFQELLSNKISKFIWILDSELKNKNNHKNKNIIITLTALGFIGIQHFYLNNKTLRWVSILLLIFVIPSIILNILLLFKYIKMDEDTINQKYSTKYQNILSLRNNVINTFGLSNLN